MTFDFRKTCERPATRSSRARKVRWSAVAIRNRQAATYYLIVESPDAANFKLRARPHCRARVPVDRRRQRHVHQGVRDSGGGRPVRGDTLDAVDDYQAQCGGNARREGRGVIICRLPEARASERIARSRSSTPCCIASPTGRPQELQSRQEACATTTADRSTRTAGCSEVLDAGAYYYVVDGFNDINVGEYLFEVTVAPRMQCRAHQQGCERFVPGRSSARVLCLLSRRQ